MIEVQVYSLVGSACAEAVQVQEGARVQDCLDAYYRKTQKRIDPTKNEFSIDGASVTLQQKVNSGDMIVVAPDKVGGALRRLLLIG